MNFNLPLFLLTHQTLNKKPVGSLPPSEAKLGEYIVRYKCLKCDYRSDKESIFYDKCCPECGNTITDKEYLNDKTKEIGRWVKKYETVPFLRIFNIKKTRYEWEPKNEV